jgi:flagellar biosynthesis/type III secretory pathway protein FliH
VKGLFEHGWSQFEVARLFRLLDWLMALPEAMEPIFWQEIKQFQEEKKMPFVTTPEKIGRAEGLKIGREEGRLEGRQEGRQEGLRNAVQIALESRFGGASKPIEEGLARVNDEGALRSFLQEITRGCTLDEIKALIARSQAP